MHEDIAIILTGTITPRAIYTDFTDAESRRSQYLVSINYYREFSKVYFIENSGYDLTGDSAFASIPNVTYIQHDPSDEFFKGKGYQEFEMLDHFFLRHGHEFPGFLKITGRYRIENISGILEDCRSVAPNEAIFERKRCNSRVAFTDVFFVTYGYYMKNILGSYTLADDSEIRYIEHVVRHIIDQTGRTRVFKTYPIKAGINGTTGNMIPNTMITRIARSVRNITYRFDHHHRLI